MDIIITLEVDKPINCLKFTRRDRISKFKACHRFKHYFYAEYSLQISQIFCVFHDTNHSSCNTSLQFS